MQKRVRCGIANHTSRIGSLELFLHQEIGIDEDAAVSYLSDGRRLTSANIRDLSSVADQVCIAPSWAPEFAYAPESQLIFVFNKYFLDYDVDIILSQLQDEPRFQPTIEGVPAGSHLLAN